MKNWRACIDAWSAQMEIDGNSDAPLALALEEDRWRLEHLIESTVPIKREGVVAQID